jgi:HAD superfamily hydrolase (TIGR01509 family)
MKTKIRGFIFDVDGTLVNSNDAHARAWQKALTEEGIDVSFSAVRAAIGMGGDKLLPAIAKVDADSPVGKRLSERRSQIFQTEYLPSLRPFPKARELVSALKAMGMKLGVASSAQESELGPLLALARVQDLMEETTSSGDAASSKPDPDIVQAALRRLALAAGHVIMVGDTPYDVQAAQRAGIQSIGFRCGGRSDDELAGAVAIYDDPADLLAKLHGVNQGARANPPAWLVG